jgi:lipopolysaccharide biosynthesis protein
MKLLRSATAENSHLAPFRDVTLIEGADGGGVFEATGDDPRMIWRPGHTDLQALSDQNAVRVRVEMTALEGRLREPCVYFDWGDGFTEETRRPLSRVAENTYSAVGHSNAGECRAVRFDPSAGPCRFGLTGFVVEGVGATAANTPRLSLPRRLVRRVLRRTPVGLQRAIRRIKAAILDPAQPADRALRALRGVLRSPGVDVWRQAYVKQFQVAQNVRSPCFAARPLEAPRRAADAPKIMAFYLPQYHPIPENDAWWGRGFTEWANVTKATPQFVDHLQPRLPADFGYYDLRVPEVQRAQARLAKLSGVDVFCFHYYWFAGRRILEKPLDSFVADPEIELPFALCWANENWTRRWDGLEQDILLAQRHSPEDDAAVFADMARYMRSPRYFKIAGKPLIIVYRPDALPEPKQTIERWRAAAQAEGLGELFILCTDAFGFSEYARFGFDGLVEFPPHAISTGEITHRVQRLNPSFSGIVYDYEAVVASKEEELSFAADPRRFPGVMPAWDNEARKPGAGNVFQGASPQLFYRWVKAALEFSRRAAPPEARMIVVNAWNEWAEGAYLEPDRWFGHGFAQALRAALEVGAPRINRSFPSVAASKAFVKKHDLIVLLHIYYSDLISEFNLSLSEMLKNADLAISFPNTWSDAEVEQLAAAFPAALLAPCPNRGRDVAPFLELFNEAWARDYPMFLKLHSKRSPHLADGDTTRGSLIEDLTSKAAVNQALACFADEPKVGLVAALRSERNLGEQGVMHNNRTSLAYLSGMLRLNFDDTTKFPAGTMFWGRTAAFEALVALKAADLPFEIELGQIDGTLAHALERSMGAIAIAAGYVDRYAL